MHTIEINNQFKQALDLIEGSGRNLLIFGKAGTGKSTFLHYCRKHAKKKIAVLAPTGVAAININGATIHSFFGFSIDITVEKVKRISKNNKIKKLLQTLDTIIIDEISMVRADLLDCVNRFLTLNGPYPLEPFGGIQMIFIGDLYQIPPVVKSDVAHFFKNFYQSPYFFSAKAFIEHGAAFELIEFEKIYRQTDTHFIELLNAIRNNTVTAKHLQALNERLQPDFKTREDEFWVYITGTNNAVKKLNDAMLNNIKEKEKIYTATTAGDIQPGAFPTDKELKLKVGAQVMLVNNDVDSRWVNGSIGHITAFTHDKKSSTDVIMVQLANQEIVGVYPHEWDVFKYEINEETNGLNTLKIGSFIQYPMRLAWALTVHKSQGKTFDHVIVDLGITFSPGQMYVALSRCTSLDGLVLKKKITTKNIFIDYRIVNFLTKLQYQHATKELPLEQKIALIKNAIANKKLLEITYLKARDEKTRRIIEPLTIGEMYYQDKKFIGLNGFCTLRKESRCFSVARILEINIL
ncbi:ATP-dependent DNA helicase PIF1 [Gammaproteobacteria bacterium]